MRLKSEGGHLDKKGVVEVISSLKADGSSVGYDIRKGVWVCIERRRTTTSSAASRNTRL